MSGQSVQVLLVEDDALDAQAIQRAFDKLKIANHITVASDGVEALDRLRGENGYERLQRPYVILLDINMPRMDGITFLKTIRDDNELKTSIVFVLTISDHEKHMTAAYNEQIAGYFLKKNVGEEFLALPELIRKYWRLVEFPSP